MFLRLPLERHLETAENFDLTLEDAKILACRLEEASRVFAPQFAAARNYTSLTAASSSMSLESWVFASQILTTVIRTPFIHLLSLVMVMYHYQPCIDLLHHRVMSILD